jgi:hypothetical protein
MDTLDVLVKARAEVEKGWTQGRPCDEHGNVCAMGALGRAMGLVLSTRVGSAPLEVYRSPASDVLHRLTPRSMTLQQLNDLPETTQADVLALFDRAINAEAQKLVPVIDPAHTYTVAA